MKRADCARTQGIDDKTAYRGSRSGILPVPSLQLPTGKLLGMPEAETATARVAVYGRVSSADQKKDLDRQIARLGEFGTRKSLSVFDLLTRLCARVYGKRSAKYRAERAAEAPEGRAGALGIREASAPEAQREEPEFQVPSVSQPDTARGDHSRR